MQLNLNALYGVKVLGKEAQKKISGGISQDPISGTCAAQSTDGGTALSGVSRADALNYATEHHTHWCCDSCSTALWYDID